jgi:hypothetical protein
MRAPENNKRKFVSARQEGFDCGQEKFGCQSVTTLVRDSEIRCVISPQLGARGLNITLFIERGRISEGEGTVWSNDTNDRNAAHRAGAGKIVSITGAFAAAVMAAVLCCSPAVAQPSRAQSDAVNAGVQSSVQSAREQILQHRPDGVYQHRLSHH